MNIDKNFTVLLLLSFVLATSCSHNKDTQDVEIIQDKNNFHIYLCFGQSNMEGQELSSESDLLLDTRFKMLCTQDCNVYSRSVGEWYYAMPPLVHCSPTKICPIDLFGRTLTLRLPEEIHIGVIIVAVGKGSISLFDKDSYQSEINDSKPTWFIDAVNYYGGNPYQRLIDMAKIAQEVGVIKGILMHQGEADHDDTTWPLKVKKVYEDILSDLALSSEDIPLLAGELVNADMGGYYADMNNIIAQLPDVIPNAHIVSSKGCESKEDKVHFSEAGYKQLGKNYAEVMLSILKYSK